MRRLLRPRNLIQAMTLGWLVALQPIWVSNSGAVCAGVTFGIGTWFFLVSVDQIRREQHRKRKMHQKAGWPTDAGLNDFEKFVQSIL